MLGTELLIVNSGVDPNLQQRKIPVGSAVGFVCNGVWRSPCSQEMSFLAEVVMEGGGGV